MKSDPQPNLFLVEGDDDKNFIETFLGFEKISQVEVRTCGGKSSFEKNIETLLSTMQYAQKCGIIRDADNNSEDAFKSIYNVLKGLGRNPPKDTRSLSEGQPQFGIFILPSNGKNGTLEDLCLESVKETPAMKCVESFYQCADKLPDPPKNPSKSKAKAYLAAMKESVPHIGTAAIKNYWDFSSLAMDDMRSFLKLFV